jgi:hypothetical protein
MEHRFQRLAPEDMQALIDALRKPVPEHPQHMTREEARELANDILEEGLKRFSQRLGVDSEEGIRSFNLNQEDARNRRETSAALKRHGIIVAWGLVITATGSILWFAFQQFVARGGK